MSSRTRTVLGLVAACAIAAGLSEGRSESTATQQSAPDRAGPTAYPEKDADWPGKGPIRKFKWMPENRKFFWSRRAQDQGAVVFTGDSLTANWKDLAKTFPELKVANRGIGGDTSRGLLFRFKEDVLELKPRAIVLLIGINDLTASGKPADGAANIEAMLSMVEKQNAATPVVLCTIPPTANPKAPVKESQREAYNAAIRKLAADHKNVTLLDLHGAMLDEGGGPKLDLFTGDKLHFGAAGYARWAEVLRPDLEKLDLKKPAQ